MVKRNAVKVVFKNSKGYVVRNRGSLLFQVFDVQGNWITSLPTLIDAQSMLEKL